MSLEESSNTSSGSIIERFASYSFATDEAYQAGISGIVSSGVLEGKSDEERAEILLRSEVFYFNRLTGSSISIDDARQVRQRSHIPPISAAVSSPPSSSGLPPGGQEEPEMLSFAQLKALIEQGRTDEIPNNKVIPNVISSEAPSESKATPRRKPWETATST